MRLTLLLFFFPHLEIFPFSIESEEERSLFLISYYPIYFKMSWHFLFWCISLYLEVFFSPVLGWGGGIFLSHNSCTLFFFLPRPSSLSSACSLLSYLCLSLSLSLPYTNRKHSAISIISSLPTYFLTLWILASIPTLQKLLLRFLMVPELPDPVSFFQFLISAWHFIPRPTSYS